MGTEIYMQYTKVYHAVCKICNLKAGTGYRFAKDCSIVDVGSGEMASAINDYAKQLEMIEEQLMEIIDKTCRALSVGMKEFISVDSEQGQLIAQKLHDTLNNKGENHD